MQHFITFRWFACNADGTETCKLSDYDKCKEILQKVHNVNRFEIISINPITEQQIRDAFPNFKFTTNYYYTMIHELMCIYTLEYIYKKVGITL